MSCLSALESDGHLGEAVALANEALDLLEQGQREEDATRCLSAALKEIQAEWSLLQGPEEPDEAKAFQAMLAQTLGAGAKGEFLSGDVVSDALGTQPAGKSLVPVQLLLVNLLLDRPEERLVIYGTLAPGRENHGVIEYLGGSYRECFVHGRITEVDGLPYFTWAPAAPSLRAQLFCSDRLPSKWDDLDRFEGSGYKRRLIPATSEDGLSIASIYLSTAGDWWSAAVADPPAP
jgi:gamma-glutamylcyclotransferase (GGCT)/AIG2-like uncharacterized protein YtfP